MGYIHRNNLKQIPDIIVNGRKGVPERFQRFCEANDILSWTKGTFSHEEGGYWNDPPFHDHGRTYFKRNDDQICVIHEYINGYKEADYDEIRRRSIAWAEKWGYACEVYPPERGWYCPPDQGGPGAACVVIHKPDVKVIIPE